MVRNCKKQTINCGYVVCWSGFGQRHCWSSVGHKIECWSSNGQASLWCDQHVSNKLATVYIARHSVELVRWFTPFWRILPMSIADNCTVGRKMPRTCKYRRELLPLNQSRDWSRGNNSLLYLQKRGHTLGWSGPKSRHHSNGWHIAELSNRTVFTGRTIVVL